MHCSLVQLKVLELNEDLVAAEERQRERVVVARQRIPLARLQAVQQQRAPQPPLRLHHLS